MDEAGQPLGPTKAVDLDLLSVDELKERIEALKAEITACEKAIENKGDAKSAADAMFNLGKS
ncbi:DUF1192 family protein [Ponticaulis profundi]|uniref:DUF1192 family protein n=1 Tax=Ponticaulis profundi TaxID=2665222 RepID=A0ABW1S7H2_9PROT